MPPRNPHSVGFQNAEDLHLTLDADDIHQLPDWVSRVFVTTVNAGSGSEASVVLPPPGAMRNSITIYFFLKATKNLHVLGSFRGDNFELDATGGKVLVESDGFSHFLTYADKGS